VPSRISDYGFFAAGAMENVDSLAAVIAVGYEI
jgi:hypothetical protein